MGFMIAGLIVGVIGTAISTLAAYRQAQAQQAAARAEAQYREQEAESLRQSAAYEERQYRKRVAALLGKQSAIMAATGLDPSSGSPLMLELDSVREAELEALNIRRTGAIGATGKLHEARLARLSASYAGGQKNLALTGGLAEMGGSILSGWAQYKKPKSLTMWPGT